MRIDVSGAGRLMASAIILCAGVAAASGAQTASGYGKVALSFQANQGQAAPGVRYLARGKGHALFLRDRDATLALDTRDAGHRALDIVRFRWIGAGHARIEGEGLQEGTSNYFIGRDRSKWRTGVPHFGSVRYRQLYPGIDLIYYGRQGQLEYDLVVQPGADPLAARFSVEGVRAVKLADSGDLLISTGSGEIRHRRPVAYQEDAGGRQTVQAEYVLTANREVRFRVGAYDRTRPLIIDPIVVYSMYFGGGSAEDGAAVAVDAGGNAYVTGQTVSIDLPTVNPGQTAGYGGAPSDAFVLKLNAAGTQILYATYLGGNGFDTGEGIAVDAQGSAYITGETASTNFPVVPGLRTALNGALDAFLVKLTPAGNGLAIGTYIGGSGLEYGTSVTVDGANNAYVAGFTNSTDLHNVVPGQALAGGWDAFVAKVNANGQAIGWTSYAGGTGDDKAYSIAWGASEGVLYIAGDTTSTNLAGTAFQPANNGGARDAFVAKISAAGARIYWAYLGGSGEDGARGVAVDNGGNVYVAGETQSPNFPSAGGAQGAYGGGWDAFLTKLNAAGTAIVYSSYLGGSLEDRGTGVAVDAAGSAYVTGFTISPNFPVASSVKSTPPGSAYDAFVTKFVPAGNAREYSTLFGGSGSDLGFGIAVDGAGNAYITGRTLSTDLPVTMTGSSLHLQDAFVAKIGNATGGCSFSITTGTANIPTSGGTGKFTLNASAANCAWNANSSTSWAQVYPLTGTGSADISYTVFPNFSSSPRNATLTAGGQTFAISQAANALTVNERFVQLIYFSYFGRLPSPAELSFQVNEALNKGVSRGELATNFLNSLEFNQGGRFVAGLYVGLLNRDAEYGGWLFQRNALASNIVTQDTLVQNFLNSSEYSQKFGTPDNATFVRLLYRFILLREASDAEVAFQASQLAAGTTRVTMARNFLNSAEFRTGTGPRLTAFLLYATLLLRDPTVTEFAATVQQLSGTSPTPVRTLVNQIVGLPEFNLLIQ